jgi:predicted nucleotidyltransferase
LRLTDAQIATIKSTISAVLGEGAQVILFGSLLHEQYKGGDVDLYVEIPRPDLMQKVRCKVQPKTGLTCGLTWWSNPWATPAPSA